MAIAVCVLLAILLGLCWISSCVEEAGDPTLSELVQTSATSVRVTWSHPTEVAPVTGYIVHYARDDGRVGTVSVGSSTTSIEITGLTSDRTYTISVEATAADGLSGESEEMIITLKPPPDPPQDVTVVDVEPASVRVSWQTVEDADRYIVSFSQAKRYEGQRGLCSTSHTPSVTVTTSPASIDVGQTVDSTTENMLKAYTTYFITVASVSDVLGRGEDSEPSQHTTSQTSAAVAPSNVRATVESSTVISVQWDGLTLCRLVNGLIVKYRVQYTPQPNGMTQSIDQTAAGDYETGAETSLTGLTPFTNYSIRVAAVNEEGDVGIYSDPMTEQTPEDTPGPVIITVIPSPMSITITWEEPEMPNGVITHYEVSFWPTGSPDSVTNKSGLETNFITPDFQEPGTSFTFTVTAFTSVGAGEPATITTSTCTLSISSATDLESPKIDQPPLIIGVVIGLIGVLVDVFGLIVAGVTVKRHSSKVAGMMTEGNPAYGLTSPRVKSTETKGDYQISQYIQPSAVPAPEEPVYEGVI